MARKFKRVKKTKKKSSSKVKPKAEWYDSPNDKDGSSSGDDASDLSSVASARPAAVATPSRFSNSSTTPFEQLLGSLLTQAHTLPEAEKQALARVRQEEEGIELSSVSSSADAPDVVIAQEAGADDDADSGNDDMGNSIDDAPSADDPYMERYMSRVESSLPTRRPSNKQAPLELPSGTYSLHAPSPLPPTALLPLKARLRARWQTYTSSQPDLRNEKGLTALQAALAPHLFHYRDAVLSVPAAPRLLRELCALHALNHCLKARDLMERHTRALKDFERRASQRRQAAAALQADPKNELLRQALQGLAVQAQGPDPDAVRDQGFTRARVLFVLPRRNAAARLVRLLQALLPEPLENMDRFQAEFGKADDEDAFLDGSHPDLQPKPPQPGERRAAPVRPRDWHADFCGNADEEFKLGLSLKGGGGRLYADFYKSDIILASPLGLRLATKLAVGARLDEDQENESLPLDEEDEENNKPAKQGEEELDFLSSIELLIVDQVDALHMQNWQHVEDLVAALNRRPRTVRPEMDFARVAERFLQGWAIEFRQNIWLQPFCDAQTNALVRQCSRNVAGLVTVRPLSYDPIAHRQGAVQRFRRVDDDDMGAQARLDHFAAHVLPALLKQPHVLLFVPSFFDLVRVKKLLRQAAAAPGAFGVCSEYTPAKDVTRLRGEFFKGTLPLLVVTERFHYYVGGRNAQP